MPKIIKKRASTMPLTQEQEIETLAHTASDFMNKHRTQAMTVAAIAAGLLLLASGYAFNKSRQELKASPIVAEAYEAYRPANGGAPDYAKALAMYQEAQKKFSGTKSGAIAQYYIGNCLANLGRTDEALKAYQSFVTSYSGEKTITGLAYQRMGYLYASTAREADARTSFEKAEAIEGPGVATVELARLYESENNRQESDKKYKIVAEKLGGTSWAMDAMGKVQKISSPAPQAGAAAPAK